MKKFIAFIVTIFLFPIVALAVDYDVEHFYVDAKVQKNGDMQVSELIVLDGTFDGYERDLVYKNSLTDEIYSASGIEDLKVAAKYIDDVNYDTFLEDFDEFTKVGLAENGDKGKYILSNLSGGYRVRMYYSTRHESTAFLIKYTIKDVVIMHDGFAEIYWNFLGSEMDDDIHDLKIRVSLPGIDNSRNYRIWAHGDINGEIDFDNTEYESRALAQDKKVPHNAAVDVRITFDESLMDKDSVLKKSSVSMIEILEKEETLADLQNKKREAQQKELIITYVLEGIFLIYTVCAWIIIYFKHDKERKPEFDLEYNRDFIEDYNVEVVDYLMNKSGITSNALSASILNLVYKKNIKVEPLKGSDKDYIFTLVNRDNMNNTENILVNFLFDKVGKKDTFTTLELKKYAKGTNTCESFLNSYTGWKNSVIKDGKEQDFFETKKGYVIYSIISLIIALFVVILAANREDTSFIIGIFAMFLAVIFFIYTLLATKKTEKGIEHFARWQAFKRFLKDFGTFDTKQLPEIVLWEKYLVYATVFGLAKEVSKSMNVKIKELEASGVTLGDIYLYNHLYYDFASTFDRTFSSALQSSQATLTSKMSSGSGSGGGFSAGGGFGGGGGGGRGF